MIPLNREKIRRVVAGVDWGFVHPGVIEVFALDGDGRMYRVWEVCRTGKTIDWWVAQGKEIHDWFKVERFVADPSEPAYIQQFQAAGLPTSAGFNGIAAGIQAVQQRLVRQADGRPRLLFLRDQGYGPDPALLEQKKPTCFEDEVVGYIWPTANRALRAKDEVPVKNDDDCCFVAGTQIRTERGENPIETIRVGDRVWTRAGLCRVTAASMTRLRALVMTGTFSNGETLTATENHPFYVVNKGWIAMRELRSDDIMVVWQKRKPSPIETSNSAAIPNPRTGLSEAISSQGRPTGLGVLAASIRNSGAMLMAPFRRGITSITRMKTRSTTASTIWNASAPRSTASVIPSPRKIDRNGVSGCLTRPFKSQQGNGTGHPKAGNGIDNMPFRRGRVVTWWRKHVTIAGRPTRSITSLPESHASAPTPASPPLDAMPGLMISREFALDVADRSLPTVIARALAAQRDVPDSSAAEPMPGSASSAKASSLSGPVRPGDTAPCRVLTLTEEPLPQAVYNLTVEGEHEYFANGILVSNCDAVRYACCYVDGIGKNRWMPMAMLTEARDR